MLQQCPCHYLYIPSGICCPLICCRYDNDWSEKSQRTKEAKDGKRISAIEGQDVYEQLKIQEEGPPVIYPSSVSAIML